MNLDSFPVLSRELVSRCFFLNRTSLGGMVMLDLMFFGGSIALIFGALFARFLYMKSLTGIGPGGSVGASYWGAYHAGLPDASKSISLPKTDGICPRCYTKMIGRTGCSEH